MIYTIKDYPEYVVAIDIGWIMVIIGLGLLIVEAFEPGFFVGVPGTILVVLGTATLLIPEFAKDWAPAIIVISALISSIVTIYSYRRIAPGHKPISTSMDVLRGKEGIVVKKVTPDSLSGKVKIDNQIWSACGETAIDEGKKVLVLSSEGVHVRVMEI